MTTESAMRAALDGTVSVSIFSLAEIEPPPPTLHEIIYAVEAVKLITVTQICSPRRQRNIIAARFLFCYLARELTTKSFPQIARLIHRDHSTVIHACQRVEADIERYRESISAVTARLGEGT